MKVYFWSDLHLFHSHIIDYENRPFKDVKEMNRSLLNNWKSTIKKKEIIFNLGDFSFLVKKDIISGILQECPGYKILILGNHDRNKSVKWWLDAGFNEVYKYPIIYENFYILSHEPIYLNKHMPYVNIHGHMHKEKYERNQHVNVSVEQINYKPVLFDDIKKIFIEKE